ncbi:related to DNA topoisomerase II binding protein [Moesziomyces antarcticus]|uniref:Related to DNA topoisomerase II binding protein n=1 Tax=Pseudozyma antarctica TaxID=84753 RepID=A0A5C3FGT9_PSEA2|nr:related to DNA topoisomerase II binding protein [Moesziomyces antarcticus]
MNRSARAHRSTKIPNVKLRPAHLETPDSLASSSKQHQNKVARRRHELIDDREDADHFRQLRDQGHDHGAHVDADFIGSSAHPLKGAVISITGLSEAKAALTQYARELGARVEGNLTEDVTHLVADRPGSQKYRFALDLGMHIVSPDWIHAVRDAWLQGDDVDALQLEQQHLLPPLSNTTICFSSLQAAERRRLVQIAHSLGAVVSDELRFDGSVTHLVSTTPDPNASSSVRHLLHFLDRGRHGRNGRREQAAAQILAVRPDWLADCQKADGCLSEQTYSIFADLPDQQQRAALIQKAQHKIPSPLVRQEKPAPPTIGSPFIASSRSSLKNPRDGAKSQHQNNGDQADEDDEEPITLGSRQKAAAAAEKSFDSILSQLRSNTGPTSSASLAPRPSRPGVASTPASASALVSASASTLDVPPARPPPSASNTTTHTNSLLGMSRASSFSRAPPSSTATPVHQRKSTTKPTFLPQHSMSSNNISHSTGPHPCFHAQTFRVCLGDPRRKELLAQVLAESGATLLQDNNAAPPQFAVVDPKQDAASLQALVNAGVTPVLHFWIEYCLHHETFVEPASYFAALPAQVPFPLPDAHRLRVFLLGFEPGSPELYHAQKLVSEMGGTVAPQIKRENLTHVVCATRESYEGRRAQRARSHGIPVVGLEFLIRAKQTGRLVPEPSAVAMIEAESLATTTSSSSTHTDPRTSAQYQRASSSRQNSNGSAQGREGPMLPLTGCTVSRSKALASQTALLERKALQLGATWQAQASEATTHLLHRGSAPPRESKELSRGVFSVHPSWLDKCLEEEIRVDESLFPSSMDPAKSLLTVLSNSDGSASGNFLSQATQSIAQHRRAPHSTQDARQTQATLVAAAKPWHRSISADAARYSGDLLDEAQDSEADTRRVRGRSEEIDLTHDDEDESGENSAMIDDTMDEDKTLGEVSRDAQVEVEEAVAPSSQTLFEEYANEASFAVPPLPKVGKTSSVNDVEKQKPHAVALSVGEGPRAGQTSSADQVLEALRLRALAQGARRKTRQRARKQRSDDPTSGRSSNEMNLPPEQVLEAQAQLDARRAAEAAAHGYSLGLDRDLAMPAGSQNGQSQSFDASVRIVYDDPAAQKERMRMLKMLEQQPAAKAAAENGAQPFEDGVADDNVPEVLDAADAGSNMSRKRPVEDSFGAGRQARHYWENRNSESPTKRPVVRRQPLARR